VKWASGLAAEQLLIRDVKISDLRPYHFAVDAGKDVEIVDHHPHLILPGFNDAHVPDQFLQERRAALLVAPMA
jgi:cytosine/adenosine deaminase-related metal-dependent hydrolase